MKKQNEKGITLIALVITIIIILILTGIAIRFAVGEDEGIITKTNQAVEGQVIAQAQDELGSAWGSATVDFMKNRKPFSTEKVEDYLKNSAHIIPYLEDKGEIGSISYDEDTEIYTVTYTPDGIDSELTFNITKSGDVSYESSTTATNTSQWVIDTDYGAEGLSVGDLVKPTKSSVSSEKFYVIGIGNGTDPVVTLLAQYCVDWEVKNAQDSTMGIWYDEGTTGALAFRANSSASDANVYSTSDIKGYVDAYVAKLTGAGMKLQDVKISEDASTATSGVKGRLMWGTSSSGEVQSALGINASGTNSITGSTIVYGPSSGKLNYWLGTPCPNVVLVWRSAGHFETVDNYYVNDAQLFGLRPVIEVLASKF